MKNFQRSKKQKPPYSGTLELPVGRSVVRVKLPKVSEYEIGAKTTIHTSYKDKPITVPLVRVEKGWDIC